MSIQIRQPFDMNGNKVENAGAATVSGDLTRFDEVGDAIVAGDDAEGVKLHWLSVEKAAGADPSIAGNWVVQAASSDAGWTLTSVAAAGISFTLAGGSVRAIKGFILKKQTVSEIQTVVQVAAGSGIKLSFRDEADADVDPTGLTAAYEVQFSLLVVIE